MALKPTIYKIQTQLADSDRHCYEELSLTLARHPSETLERMTARLLAYCLNAGQGLSFTRGLSSTDEPDLWQHSDSGEIEHWLEVGHPEPGRLRKACGRARRVSVYAFASSTDTWWSINAGDIETLQRSSVWQLPWPEVEAAATLIERNTQLSVSIAGGVMYLDNGSTSQTVEPRQLFAPDAA